MAKSKQNADVRKSHKKSKKSKLPKSPKSLKDRDSSSEINSNAKTISLNRKQTELARVFNIKCALLMQGNLPYLEYIELREEICRLIALKEIFVQKAIAVDKC